ncbi:DUF3068 domain-containing protein [Kribbella sp. NPDC004536]|uniref:DUF3068 domain-containing protein n=1 Tax=Kribbella sp. NPDC004536 TaxID=3364106 RepID=UPI00367547FE
MGTRRRAVLVGLGVFFVAVAALTRFYAMPALATAPEGQVAHTVSVGSDATIFSVADLKEKTGVRLEARRTVRGDVAAAEKISTALHRKVVVYDTAVVTDDSRNYHFPKNASETADLPLSFVQERVVLDARTGEAVRWNPSGGDNSGEYITTTLAKADRLRPDPNSALFKGHEGLVLKFPFATKKTTYRFWDTTLRKAFPIHYKSEATLDGLKVYVFEQNIPRQEVPLAKPLLVPGKLVGQPGKASVPVQRTYENTRTLWIEPVTGAIIKGKEQQLATIAYNGEDKLTATQVSIEYDDATVRKNVAGATENNVAEGGYKSKAAQLHLIGFWIPLGTLLCGVLALGAIVRRPRRGTDGEVQ